jgi:D-glycero-D-manno-heptose 1,7-bisphosphate phosphatase
MSSDKASLTPMNKLLLVDCDGTIREPLSRNKFIQHPRDQKIIAGVREAIAYFHAQGYTIIGISNQGGVAMGYKSLEDTIAEQLYTLELLPRLVSIYFCPDMEGKHCWLVSREIDAKPIHTAWAARWAGTFRKPQPGMIYAAILNHCGENQPEECLYVGDRNEDFEAAAAVGVRFMWADSWRDGND